jgi:putative transposase
VRIKAVYLALAVPPEIRPIPTTNALESVHAQPRKIIAARRHFPNDDAAMKLIWLALRNFTAKMGARRARGTEP